MSLSDLSLPKKIVRIMAATQPELHTEVYFRKWMYQSI